MQRVLVVWLMLTTWTNSAWAQELNDAMRKCAATTETTERLACFDKAANDANEKASKAMPKERPSANKPNIAELDMIDFLVDGKQFMGKKVAITGCSLSVSGNTSVCRASNSGYFFITSFANSDDQKAMMRNCATFNGCPLKLISGTVGRFGGGELALSKVELIRE